MWCMYMLTTESCCMTSHPYLHMNVHSTENNKYCRPPTRLYNVYSKRGEGLKPLVHVHIFTCTKMDYKSANNMILFNKKCECSAPCLENWGGCGCTYSPSFSLYLIYSQNTGCSSHLCVDYFVCIQCISVVMRETLYVYVSSYLMCRLCTCTLSAEYHSVFSLEHDDDDSDA